MALIDHSTFANAAMRYRVTKRGGTYSYARASTVGLSTVAYRHSGRLTTDYVRYASNDYGTVVLNAGTTVPVGDIAELRCHGTTISLANVTTGEVLAVATNSGLAAGLWVTDDAYADFIGIWDLDVEEPPPIGGDPDPPAPVDVAARPLASTSTARAVAERIGGIRAVEASASSPSQASAESSRIGGVRSLFARASALSAATALVERIRPSTATFTSRASSSASASVVRRGGVRVVSPVPITLTGAVRTGYHLLTAALSRPRGLWGDVITVWRKGPEVDYHATWRREIISSVRVEERRGAVAALSGMQTSDGATVYIDARGRNAHFSPLQAEDRLALGVIDLAEPPKGALVVTAVEEHRLRGRLHHWAIAAR